MHVPRIGEPTSILALVVSIVLAALMALASIPFNDMRTGLKDVTGVSNANTVSIAVGQNTQQLQYNEIIQRLNALDQRLSDRTIYITRPARRVQSGHGTSGRDVLNDNQ